MGRVRLAIAVDLPAMRHRRGLASMVALLLGALVAPVPAAATAGAGGAAGAGGSAGAGGAAGAGPLPACAIRLAPEGGAGGRAGGVRAVVGEGKGEREITLDGGGGRAEALRLYPGDARAVLVAVVYAGGDRSEPAGSDTLWRVPCGAGAGGPAPVKRMAGADFGHSALSPDGRTLWFTGPDGVYALDLRTRKARRLTRAASPDCARQGVRARDVVRGAGDRDALLFERGCGYEWKWHAAEMVLRGPGAARMTVEPVPRTRVAAVAVDAAGAIWLSDGVCRDRSTWNRVLRSTDRGASWTSVPVKQDPALPFVDQPVRQIIADRARPGALLAFTESCDDGGQHTEPAWIYVRDGDGQAFRAIAPPPGLPGADTGRPGREADPLYAVAAPTGSLAELIVYGQSNDLLGDAIARWQSRDAGRSWLRLAPVSMAAAGLPAPLPSATFGAWKVAIAEDRQALVLTEPPRPPVRIYPPR
jgi:hypothetical protein